MLDGPATRPKTPRRKPGTDEAAFTGSAGNVRALPGIAKKEPERRAAIDRSRCQSSEVTHGQFRPVSESQLPRGQTVVTAHQHGMNDSGGLQLRRSAKRKTPKGGTKGAFEPGRSRRPGMAREKLPQGRRCRKRHRWAVSEKQPESEEARPVARGERTAKSCC
jgi:hypothetical protein